MTIFFIPFRFLPFNTINRRLIFSYSTKTYFMYCFACNKNVTLPTYAHAFKKSIHRDIKMRIAITLITTFAIALNAQAESKVDEIYDSMSEIIADSQKSQQLIDELSDDARTVYLEYREQLKINEGLTVYNAQLQEQIDFQNQELAKLNKSIDNVTLVERQIMPLMMQMVKSLEQFIDADLPFSMSERQDRIAFLNSALLRSDVSISEKYRQVLEAYLVEIDYGRKIESYQDTLAIEGVDREVDILRIGRTVLAFQTLDQSITGVWNRTKKDWEVLDNSYKNPIRNAIRMARKQVTPDLTVLPIAVSQ